MKKRYWIPLLILAILIGLRIALPYWVTDFVNRSLDDIEGYTGQIAGVDISLLQGFYAVDSLTIQMDEAGELVPFATVDRIQMNIDWGSLLQGAIVGEVAMMSPSIHFVAAPVEQTGEDVDWVEAVQELMPIRLNKFSIVDGTITYHDFDSEPEIHLPLEDLNVEIFNITNIEQVDEDLPTRIEISAVSVGDGQLNMTADASLLQEIPDLQGILEFEEMNLPDLNEFMEAYAGVDVESGKFSLYSEFEVRDGAMDGTLQPMIFDLSVLDLTDEDHDFFSAAWEVIVEGVTQVFRARPEDQFATQVPISGRIDDAEVGVFPAIWNIFRNAFIEAFEEGAVEGITFDPDEDS